MAELHLVTGYKGVGHVTAADQGILNAMGIGAGEYVFPIGERFRAEIIDNNTVRIYGGSLLMQGRQVNFAEGAYSDVNIENGTQGKDRNDIIVVTYAKDIHTGVETATFDVCEGTPASTYTATDPTLYNPFSILEGFDRHDMPLYRVVVRDLTIIAVEPMFRVLAPLADLHNGFRTTNMLINGDFSCNQRGKVSYDATKTAMYTVDMWRAYAMRVVAGQRGYGVILEGTTDGTGYFTQFIQLDNLKGIDYTISAKIEGKICTFTVNPGAAAKKKTFNGFEISALTTSTWDNQMGGYNNKLKINICTLGYTEIFVEYIDVFEGSVAYPHVPEDPALALARCRRYVQYNSFSVPVFKATLGDGGHGGEYRIIVPYEKMYADPTVESCTWKYLDENEKWQSNTKFTAYESAYSGCKQVGTEYAQAMHPDSNCVIGAMVVTCEPQDS